MTNIAKLTAGALLLVTGFAWATSQTLRTEKKMEKVKPVVGFSAKVQRATSQVPQLLVDGSEDGVPYGLQLQSVNDRKVKLSWLSPEPLDGYFEDFESHPNFEINSPGSIGWSYVDGDNRVNYVWQACTFPNMGEKMAFIVMNPSQTTPATDGNPDFTPYSGEKMLVDFAAVDGQNNDYLISPHLSFDTDFRISFRARSYKVSTSFPMERIRVGYSIRTMKPSDFVFVNEGDYIELPAEWTLVEYTIPKEAKYVTINSVSNDAFMLMIDDIFIGTNKVRPGIGPRRLPSSPALVGFNVYRNGTKVNDAPVDEIRFVDEVDDYGTYDYTVTALYADGTESAASTPLTVEVPDIRLLPFEDDFDDWTLHEDKWTVVAEDGNESKWKIDYYTYGLTDPSASFGWSAITDYDQSLMSRELHTLDRASTYVRFNLRLQHEKFVNLDNLALQVSCDNGNTWKTVTTFDNIEGEFNWRTHQFSLAKYLTNDFFRIRFRAYGDNAYYIDYWYVDDVKVWNPVWLQASLGVATAEGPVAEAAVTLVGDHGGVYELLTDADGKVNIDKIEKGTYEVTVNKTGCNEYHGSWTLDERNEHLNIHLTRPVLHLSSDEHLRLQMAAEDKGDAEFLLTNEGDGPLSWTLERQLTKGTGDDAVRWKECRTWTTSGDLQTSIAFDGEYYYTTSSIRLGEFWKYTRQGKLVEHFSIPEMYYKLYDLTYDGRYFYGSDYKNRLFQLDFENRKVVSVITISELPSLEITHCSYDPDRDAFWVGGMSTIALVRRDGSLVSLLTQFSTTESIAVFGSAYDNVSPGGPYLWLADETAADQYSLDCVQLRQYNLNTRKLTDVKHVVKDVPGYVVGNPSMGRNYICGLHTTTALTDGRLTLIGVLQQSPSLIFEYTLDVVDDWLRYSPKHGVLQPGEQQVFKYTLDALKLKSGDVVTATSRLLTIPELEEKRISFTLDAHTLPLAPRPQQLTAAADSAAVRLQWLPGEGDQTPTGYTLFRNGQQINDTPITATTYTDRPLVYGNYIYKVRADYADGKKSALSDSAEVFVKRGAPYYPPLSLKAEVEKNQLIHLSWRSPLSLSAQNDTMSWATGEHVDQLGVYESSYFYAASVWEPEDLVQYRNKTIKSVSVQLVNPCTYLALLIIKDGTTIYKKAYKGEMLYNGSFTEVALNAPLTIDPASTYYFAFQIMHDAGVQPLSIDGNKAVDGKGNMLSEDGKNWFSALNSGIDGNFNIRVNLVPNEQDKEQQPVGYDIYRDGQLLTPQPVDALSYTDGSAIAGTHHYQLVSRYADGGFSAYSERATANIISIDGRFAPAAMSGDVEINRHVSLRWDYPLAAPMSFNSDLVSRPVTVSDNCPEMVSHFHGTGSEMAIASDGRAIYTSVYGKNGRVNKYSLRGELLDHFTLSGLESIRNIAYDGEYFYVADNQTNIKRVDMEQHKVLETIDISEYARHLAYVPELNNGRGGFEVGDWETSIFVSKDGSKLASGPELLGAAGTACHNGLLYAFEQGHTQNAFTVGVYDMTTFERVDSINLEDYVELTAIEQASAGGMSVITTAEGLQLLALALQRADGHSTFVFLQLEGVKGVSGYNIYRNGERQNETLLTHRFFAQDIVSPGTYDYTVETVYVDDLCSSPSSNPVRIEIVSPDEALPPVELKAVQASYGYNVNLSFADPSRYEGASLAVDAEDMQAGRPVTVEGWVNVDNRWTATDERAYDGKQSMSAVEGNEAFLVLPAADMTCLQLVLSTLSDSEGKSGVEVLYSTTDEQQANFIALTKIEAVERWKEQTVTLPAGVRYVALRKQATQKTIFVDALRLFTEAPQSKVYAYDVWRDGKQLNDEPVREVSFTDKNLLPGNYTYQVRLTTMRSAVSELSAPVEIALNYDNKRLPPTGLTAALLTDNTVSLSWQQPAIGEPVWLRWHDGNCHDAAGLPNGGSFFAAVRWSASDLKDYSQLALTDVEVFVNQVPDALYLLVYEANNLVRQQFVPRIEQRSFNTITLDEPLPINTSKELKVAIYVEHNAATVPLGYDAGPAKSGYGDLYSTDGHTWTTLGSSDTSIDGNWNISIGLSPYGATAVASVEEMPLQNVLLGYNVYRNKELLNDDLVPTTSYLDSKPYTGRYLEYQVAAVYSLSGESFSEKVTVVGSGMDEVTVKDGLRISLIDGRLRIIGASAGTPILLYTMAGELIISHIAADSYATVLPAAPLLTGTYLLSIGRETIKLQVR